LVIVTIFDQGASQVTLFLRLASTTSGSCDPELEGQQLRRFNRLSLMLGFLSLRSESMAFLGPKLKLRLEVTSGYMD